MSLEDHIAVKRQRLHHARERVPILRERAAELTERAARMTARYRQRARNDLLRDAASLESEATLNESGIPEIEFDSIVSQYAREHKRRHPIAAEAPSSSSRIITTPGGGDPHTIDTYMHTNKLKETHKNVILAEYLSHVEGVTPPVVTRPRDNCPICSTALMLNSVKAAMVCPHCGYCIAYLDATAANMSYSDEYELSSFSYKRSTHFEDCMKQIQGKESFVVPDDVLQMIMHELYTQRVLRVEDVTQTKVRTAMKRLRQRKYYDHVAQVTMRLSGVRPPRISAEAEEACKRMFTAMGPVFDKHAGVRKNFLSYKYVLFRFFHLLGLKHMLTAVCLLKGHDKLQLADTIFEKVCAELGWNFVPIDAIIAG
jgi:hypothetical protein